MLDLERMEIDELQLSGKITQGLRKITRIGLRLILRTIEQNLEIASALPPRGAALRQRHICCGNFV